MNAMQTSASASLRCRVPADPDCEQLPAEWITPCWRAAIRATVASGLADLSSIGVQSRQAHGFSALPVPHAYCSARGDRRFDRRTHLFLKCQSGDHAEYRSRCGTEFFFRGWQRECTAVPINLCAKGRDAKRRREWHKTANSSASGTITIYNTQSSAQTLVANTRFATTAGLVYRIRSAVGSHPRRDYREAGKRAGQSICRPGGRLI